MTNGNEYRFIKYTDAQNITEKTSLLVGFKSINSYFFSKNLF